MIRSPEIRAKIMRHHKRNMSPRGIATIYGCSEADVKNVVETEKADHIILSGVPVAGGKALHPVRDTAETPESAAMRLFKQLPEDLQEVATGIARMMDIHVARLFTSSSKRQQDVFYRGCFYYELKCKFNLSYEAIGALAGVSVHTVSLATQRYCEQVGAPRPGELTNARRAVA
ncbi:MULTISPECIES: hypothetical protein [unclassified Pseudovibrio]|uniref:hypothetical protein n=1 Tax=unclassified Pseudovibrio TaxID=2627060 RepID=UPI0007AE9ED9|nr:MULTISPECIES: hypothetical protein [unclassified Pseudovibrio]KZL02290.1 hypothetical protein PsW74_01388 [Pseudovibrio sp. W74]KZL08166.1 hypothetical protein PsAD14_03313 [Pseudovibrio sp. Ad14]